MEKCFAFNSVNGDRRYLAEDFREYFSSFIGNGVFPNPSTGLQVYSNNDMTITVKEGKGWINGAIYVNTDDLILSIDPADGVLNRIDRIVLRFDTLNREIKIYVKKGIFASSPIAPVLQRDADIHELALADVNIKAGSIEILQSNINDLRLNSALCGIVVGTVKEIDTTTLYLKLQSYIDERGEEVEEWINDATTAWGEDFNNWFETVKDTLDGDTAGNLLNKILEVSKKADEFEKDIKEEIETNINNKLEEIKRYGSDFKDSVASAITAKGVSTSGTDNKQTFVNNIDSIKTKLPILQGDVGVTEDSEGNVYGVQEIRNNLKYDLMNLHKLDWQITDNANLQGYCITEDDYIIFANGPGRLYRVSVDGVVGAITSGSNGETSRVSNVISIDGFLYFIGRFLYGSATNTNVGFTKLDMSGNIIWKNTNYTTIKLLTYKDTFIYGINNTLLYKFDLDGNKVWEYSVAGSTSIEVSSNNFLYVAVDKILKKISLDGELIREVTLEKSSLGGMMKIDNEENIYLTTSDSYLIKLNKDLNIVFELYFPSLRRICLDRYNYVFVSAPEKISKIDPQGKLIWELSVTNINYYNTNSPLILDKYSNYYIINSSTVKKYKDSCILEKVAVLKER